MESKLNYKLIYDRLKQKIKSGTYPPGSLLPTEVTLSEKYGVSRPTVARAYNMLQNEGIITKKKGMGTIVNPESAKTIRPTFGLLLPGAGESEIFSIINDRLLSLSKEGHFNCLWDGATANNADIRRELITECCESYISRKVDGVLFSPLERVRDAENINIAVCNMFAESGIPIVLIDRDVCDVPERSRHDMVCLDNFSAGYLMARHLIKKNCRDIHFFFRPDSAASVKIRLAGIREAIYANGMEIPDYNIHCGNPECRKAASAIEINKGKTGIICANDSTAAVLMSTLSEIGYKISSDVLICGFDDMKYSRHLRHPLSSFRQPCQEIADSAVELMFRRLDNPSAPPFTVLLSGCLVERESTSFRQFP